jgi:hypothetical protein
MKRVACRWVTRLVIRSQHCEVAELDFCNGRHSGAIDKEFQEDVTGLQSVQYKGYSEQKTACNGFSVGSHPVFISTYPHITFEAAISFNT